MPVDKVEVANRKSEGKLLRIPKSLLTTAA